MDGQNTRGPISASSAGINVNAASSMRATATARLGPRVVKNPREASSMALKAMITTPAAEAMAWPTRSTAVATAALGSSPARSRSRNRNSRNRM